MELRNKLIFAVVLTTVLVAAAFLLAAPAGAQAAQTSQTQTPAQKPQQPTTGEAGGPTGDVGPYAIPKKKEEAPAPPPPRRTVADKDPQFTMSVNVPLVTLDVLVTTKDGQFIPGLGKGNFKVYEDGVPQAVSNFSQGEAPITAVLLVEFSAANYGFFLNDVLNASYSFAQSLKKNDWVAVVAYDMRPEILVDFTQDKNAVYSALGRLRIPGFRETNMFDALYDTLDRIEGIEGRKYVILVSSGCDSFSKLTYDKILKKVQSTHNITIYPVGTGQALRLYFEGHQAMQYLTCSGFYGDEAISRLEFLQADNEMNTFARLTGGHAFFPRFGAEFPEIFQSINASIRNEYVIGYHPTNSKLDGTYRKLKVEVVAPDGGPLKVKDQKGKDLKYTIMAREGYTAKHTVE